jgi:hypothetical protein
VNIQFFGGLNLPELYKHVTPEKHWEAIVVNADSLTREVLPAASRAAGERIHQSIVIVDLKGFGFVVGAFRLPIKYTNVRPGYHSFGK